MKLVKSLLLGSAAVLVAGASAQAADLPTRKAAPVEYVRICDAYGAGFFYIPGTETCLQLSGIVRAEYNWSSAKSYGVPGAVKSARSLDSIGVFARGRLNVDARTQTSWGTLRSYFRYEMQRNTGVYGYGDMSRLYYGFIQFAGITAGRAQSFFDFYANAWNYGTLRGSDSSVNLLAYTATFGGGFSATLSLEDPSARSWGVKGVATTTGAKYLDVIGALRVDQGWGSAQLSGAFGRRTTYLSAAAGALHKDYDIWAIQGGVKINLPMLAAGDTLYLQAAYAKGASGYLGGLPGVRNGFQGTYADALSYATPTGYSVAINKGWVATAAFQHYWTPSFRSVLMGSYLSVDYGSVMKAAGYYKGTEWRVGGMMIWSPVKELDIGLELLYAKVNNKVSAPTAAAIAAAGLKRNPDSIEARVRFQRSF